MIILRTAMGAILALLVFPFVLVLSLGLEFSDKDRGRRRESLEIQRKPENFSHPALDKPQ